MKRFILNPKLELLRLEGSHRHWPPLNDADATGLAEMAFGAGRGLPGTVIVLTLGTGIGTAIFHRGKLLPNAEFGHQEIKGKEGRVARI